MWSSAVFEVMGRKDEVDEFAQELQKFQVTKSMDWDGAISKFTEVSSKRNGEQSCIATKLGRS